MMSLFFLLEREKFKIICVSLLLAHQALTNNMKIPNTFKFCSSTKKILLMGGIEEINQINNDRIIKFKIKNFDELDMKNIIF